MKVQTISSRAVAVIAAAALMASGTIAISTVTADPAQAKSSKLAKPKVKKIKKKTYYVGQTIKVKGKRMKNINKVRLGTKTAKVIKRTSKYIKIKLPKVTKSTKAHWYKLAFYYPKKKSAWKNSFYYVKSQRIRVAVKKNRAKKVTKPKATPTATPTPKPSTPAPKPEVSVKAYSVTDQELSGFATAYNSNRVAMGLQAVPASQIKSADSLPAVARVAKYVSSPAEYNYSAALAGKATTASCELAKTLEQAKREVIASDAGTDLDWDDAHTGACFDTNSGGGEVWQLSTGGAQRTNVGGNAAGFWKTSAGHAAAIYKPAAGSDWVTDGDGTVWPVSIPNGFKATDAWWDATKLKNKWIANEKAKAAILAQHPSTAASSAELETYAQSKGASDWSNYIASRTETGYCLYFTSVKGDLASTHTAVSVAGWGKCA